MSMAANHWSAVAASDRTFLPNTGGTFRAETVITLRDLGEERGSFTDQAVRRFRSLANRRRGNETLPA